MIGKTCPFARLVAGLSLLAVVLGLACGGSAKAPATPTVDPSVSTADPLVAAQAMLGDSGERTKQAQSFRAEFSETIEIRDGVELTTDGTMSFRAPADMYMRMQVMGEEMEMRMAGPDVYLRPPGGEWQVMTAESMGINREQYQQYLDNRGPMNYGDMTQKLQDLEQLPDEVIDSVDCAHYRGTLDWAASVQDLPADTFPAETIQRMKEFPPMRMEVWIDKATRYPRRAVTDMEMPVSESSTTKIHISVDYLEFNGPVDIPELPANAAPFAVPTP